MAKKDGLDIPAFLRRTGNEKPSEAARVTTVVAAPARRKPSYVPKGMTEEEYNTMKAKLDPTPAPGVASTKKPAPRVESTKKARPTSVEGATTLADIARKNNKNPRDFRRIARSAKKEFAPLWVVGAKKYTVASENEAAVLKLALSLLAKAKKPEPKKKAKKPAKAKKVEAEEPKPVLQPSKLIKAKK